MKRSGFLNKWIKCLIVAAIAMLFAVPVHAGGRVYLEWQVYDMGNNQQSGNVKGYDSSGNQIWYYQCGSYSRTELDSVTMLGIRDDRFYLVESGTVVALDCSTGQIMWTNSDFRGCPSQNGFQVSSSGKVYLCGYYGPDLFIADRNGKTMSRVNSLAYNSYWPYNLRFTTGDNMKIDYESDNSTLEFNVVNYFGTIQY
ncbi:MAG: PQQ-binding-like beta-propeller repeat protein [Eubacteriales bacterium]|nr:PQQ-binding-like beta-propeller repeat protein [Eubacteriales bacterium]